MIRPECGRYVLTDAYRYKDVTVPIGFHTDGLSYKFWLIGIVVDKYDPRYIEAAVVHDYLVVEGDWDKANKYFEELLPDTLVCKAMVKGVKMYRWYIGK